MTVKKRMNVIFKDEEEYQKFKSGKIHSDKGLRTQEGKLSSLPDIEEIEDEKVCYDDVRSQLFVSQKEMGVGQQLIYAIFEGLYEGVKEFLSDEQNRQAIATFAINWWSGKAIPDVKKGWNTVKEFVHDVKSGEIKASKLIEEKKIGLIEADYVEVNANEEIHDNRPQITLEEYQHQVDQIKVLAMLLVDRIKTLSSSCVDSEGMSEEEYRIQQQEIKELTTDNVLKSIKLLVTHESFLLDESTTRILSEFIAGNIIVEDELIPIEMIRNFQKRERKPLGNL